MEDNISLGKGIILIGDTLYSEDPDTHDLTRISLCEHQMVFSRGYASIVEVNTGKVVSTLALAHRLSDGFSAPSKAQLEDSALMATGEIQPLPSRAKKVIDNPYANELFYYQQVSNSKFRDCVYLICSSKDTLKNPQNKKLNFNFNDLCRILVFPKFSSDHLFSDERANRYTLKAFHSCLVEVVHLCRKEIGGYESGKES